MFDLTTQAKLFNEYLTPGVVAQIKARSKLFDQLRKSWDTVEPHGQYAKQRILINGSQATRSSNSSSYPTASQSTPDYTLVYLKRAQMFSMQFDGFGMELAAKGGAAMDAIEFEKKGLFITLSDDMSRQLMLDGSSRLCQANGAVVGSATLIVNSPFYADATKFLKKGRVIDAYNAGPAKQIDSIAVSTLDSTTQVTLASVQTCDDDCWIFNEDVYPGVTEVAGKGDMMGLDGIVRATDPPTPNATAGLQGLLVANVPEWAAVSLANSGVDRELSEDLIVSAFDETEDYGEVSIMLATHKVRRKWLKLLTSFKTIPNQKVMWGGWSGLPFYYDGREVAMVADRFVPDGRIYGLTEKELTLHCLTKNLITWEKGDAGNYLQKVANKNEYVAEGHIFANLGTALRRCHFVIDDIKET